MPYGHGTTLPIEYKLNGKWVIVTNRFVWLLIEPKWLCGFGIHPECIISPTWSDGFLHLWVRIHCCAFRLYRLYMKIQHSTFNIEIQYTKMRECWISVCSALWALFRLCIGVAYWQRIHHSFSCVWKIYI